MEDNNIKWEVGDIAICKIVGNLPDNADPGEPPPLRLNAEYVVNIVRVCECGGVTLDVGLSSRGPRGTRCPCGARASGKTGIHWANASRFVKKRTNSAIEVEIAAAIADENFELADKLHKELEP
jgi:hypothetical protein